MARGTRECGTTRGGCGKMQRAVSEQVELETRRPGEPRRLLLAAGERVQVQESWRATDTKLLEEKRWTTGRNEIDASV